MRNGTPIPFSHAPFLWDIPPWLSIRLCLHAGSSFGISILRSDIFWQNGGGIAPLLPAWYVSATHGSAPGGSLEPPLWTQSLLWWIHSDESTGPAPLHKCHRDNLSLRGYL